MLKTWLMCQRQASFEMNFYRYTYGRSRLNNRLMNADRSIDSIRHHCKHSKARKRTKTLLIKYTYRPNDFISELNSH